LYNSFINKLSKINKLFSYLSIRSSLARKIFINKIKSEFEVKYNLIELINPLLLKANDSKFGNPIGFTKNGKFYTNLFLNILIEYHQINKNIKNTKIDNVVELGAEIKILANIFLQLNKKIRYYIVDIPPAIFIAEHYLRRLGYRVCGYKEIGHCDKNFKDFDIILLPTWKLNILKNINFDLFINQASFQEMEKEQSLHYLNFFKKNTKFIFLKML
jgi:putative sugar O-methyltransferase